MKDLEPLYTEEDFDRDIGPYTLYRKSLEELIDFNQVESFADFGCINGKLLESLKRKYSHLNIAGFDIFEWAKDYADPLVQSALTITDLRKPFDNAAQYDVVNCTEVGEHIEPEYEEVLLQSLTRATKYWLVLSWSNEVNPQHFNPHTQRYMRKQLDRLGFEYLPAQSALLSQSLERNVNDTGYQWWSKTVSVYQRRGARVHKKFKIPGTIDKNPGSLLSYKNPLLMRGTMQDRFMKLTATIARAVGQKKFFSLARFGDGDFFFLMRWAKGSAAVGRRGTTIPYAKIDTAWFRYWFLKNDYISQELQLGYRQKYVLYVLLHSPLWNIYFLKQFLRGNRSSWTLLRRHYAILWQSICGSRYPFEAVYALVATRWLFRAYKNQIGLIGNEAKLDLIKQLMKHKAYRDYIGVDYFTDYIAIPQKGAADKPEELISKVGEEVTRSEAKIFLVGAGHAKTGLLARMAAYSDAVFIDIGTGVDALAGCISHERPYFAEWVNYRLKDYDYSVIDQMDYDDTKENMTQVTVWLSDNDQ